MWTNRFNCIIKKKKAYLGKFSNEVHAVQTAEAGDAAVWEARTAREATASTVERSIILIQ
jgi:hypothetical protein